MANLGLRPQRATSVCRMSQHLSAQLDPLSKAPHQCFLSCVQGHEAGRRCHVLPVDFVHMHFHDTQRHCPMESQRVQTTLYCVSSTAAQATPSCLCELGCRATVVMGAASQSACIGPSCEAVHRSGETVAAPSGSASLIDQAP